MDLSTIGVAISQNPILAALVALLIGSVVPMVILFIYMQMKIGAAVQAGATRLGNYVGLMVYKYILSKIKDAGLRNQLTTDLDESGGKFDAGWDQGIRGVILP